MRQRSSIVAAIFIVAALVPLTGCGDNDNDVDIIVGTPTPGGNRTATPAPQATQTPDGATPTVTATAGGGDTPTPTPTSTGGEACGAGESVVVTLSLDATITSARVDLGYPGSVNLPGTGTDQSVADRVDFAGSGLTVVNDFDQNGDLTDDTLTMSLVGTQMLDPGVFSTVTFDCVEDQPKPDAGSFACTVVSASLGGTAVTAACSVAAQ
jgi:hypothetical protein